MDFAGFVLVAAALVSLVSGCAASPTKVEAAVNTPQTSAAGLGQRIKIGDALVTPLSVLEDSRCPSDVQCIQAGTVRISIRIEQLDRISTQEIGLDAPYDLGGRWLQLAAACPYPRHAGPNSTSRPHFTFIINQTLSPRPIGARCQGG